VSLDPFFWSVRIDDRMEFPDIEAELISLAPPGVLVGHRYIGPGDEHALLPSERESFGASVPKVLRQSGAARIVARALLEQFEVRYVPLCRRHVGGPVWPQGIVGSLSHDDDVALAAISRRERFLGIGIDVEPPKPLPRELVSSIATASERARYNLSILESRLLFCVKEAIFKALSPIDGVFLDFHDVEVDLCTGIGNTIYGKRVRFKAAMAPHVIALAAVEVP